MVQVYLSSHNCRVVRPLKELKAYKRISVKAGESVNELIKLEKTDFCYYDENMIFDLHDGCHTVMLGTSACDISAEFELEIKDGEIKPAK